MNISYQRIHIFLFFDIIIIGHAESSRIIPSQFWLLLEVLTWHFPIIFRDKLEVDFYKYFHSLTW